MVKIKWLWNLERMCDLKYLYIIKRCGLLIHMLTKERMSEAVNIFFWFIFDQPFDHRAASLLHGMSTSEIVLANFWCILLFTGFFLSPLSYYIGQSGLFRNCLYCVASREETDLEKINYCLHGPDIETCLISSAMCRRKAAEARWSLVEMQSAQLRELIHYLRSVLCYCHVTPPLPPPPPPPKQQKRYKNISPI